VSHLRPTRTHGRQWSSSLNFIDKVVAGALVSFIKFALLCCLLIVSPDTLSRSCPFPALLSLILCFLIRFGSECREYLETTQPEAQTNLPQHLMVSMVWAGSTRSNGKSCGDNGELPMASPPGKPPPLSMAHRLGLRVKFGLHRLNVRDVDGGGRHHCRH
jgi:hypothetical protein